MALVEFGGGIIKMSGKIAGNVFGRNRAGDYVRAWKKPINPKTFLQNRIRAAMALLAERWHSTVTAVQRTAWNQYAGNVVMKNKLGQATYLSGYNHYMRSNLALETNGLALIDAGPVIFNLAEQDPQFAITPDASDNTIDFVFDDTMDWCDEDDAYMFIYQGKPQGEQVNFFDGPWQFIQRIDGDVGAPPASPLVGSIAPQVIDYNQNIWCYARILRADGRLSEPFRSSGLTGNPP